MIFVESTISKLFVSLPPPLPLVIRCEMGDIMPCGPPIGIGNRGAIMNGFGGGINGGGKNGGRASPNGGIGPSQIKFSMIRIEKN